MEGNFEFKAPIKPIKIEVADEELEKNIGEDIIGEDESVSEDGLEELSQRAQEQISQIERGGDIDIDQAQEVLEGIEIAFENMPESAKEKLSKIFEKLSGLKMALAFFVVMAFSGALFGHAGKAEAGGLKNILKASDVGESIENYYRLQKILNNIEYYQKNKKYFKPTLREDKRMSDIAADDNLSEYEKSNRIFVIVKQVVIREKNLEKQREIKARQKKQQEKQEKMREKQEASREIQAAKKALTDAKRADGEQLALNEYGDASASLAAAEKSMEEGNYLTATDYAEQASSSAKKCLEIAKGLKKEQEMQAKNSEQLRKIKDARVDWHDEKEAKGYRKIFEKHGYKVQEARHVDTGDDDRAIYFEDWEFGNSIYNNKKRAVTFVQKMDGGKEMESVIIFKDHNGGDGEIGEVHILVTDPGKNLRKDYVDNQNLAEEVLDEYRRWEGIYRAQKEDSSDLREEKEEEAASEMLEAMRGGSPTKKNPIEIEEEDSEF